MRVLLVGCVLAAVVVPLTACGGGSSARSGSGSKNSTEQKAALYDIDKIERNWHESISRRDIKLMMSLWAPDATFTVGPGQTLTGKDQIRHFWVSNVFPNSPPWVLTTPAYKIRETVNGDKGTLYFECDHIDLKSRKVIAVTASDMQVALIGGHWLITTDIGSTPTLSA